ncbi:MAG: divergent polysaccharide deacetylase family protein [Gammaproteobacteria bacterium]|nr:divergent polysaccharide deacetylase family protein [Gammaproteobacteria bacterium]
MSLPVTLWAQDNLVPVAAAAPQAYAPKVQVSIIIDDLGLRLEQDLRVLALPGAITNAVLPKATHTHRIAALADRLDKEVMIHLPMESLNYGQLDAGGLTAGMSQQAFKQVVESAIAAVPEAVGINNHMGSLLTADSERMRWLMEVIDRQTDLYFVDSRTSVKSVAFRHARDSGIPTLSRDIFLDNDLDEAKIERQFDAMIAVAKRRGKAIAIGHPNRQTIAVLERRLPTLAKLGVELVSVSELLQPKAQRVPLPPFELELSPVRIAKRDSYEEFILQSGVLGSRQPVRFFSPDKAQ